MDLTAHRRGLSFLAPSPPHLVEHNELIAPKSPRHPLLPLSTSPDDLVPPELRHLRGPLAGAAPDPVDEHPLPRLYQLSVSVRDEVVSRHPLNDARSRDVDADAVGDGEDLAGGDGRVLGVGAEDGVGDAVAYGDACGLGCGGGLGHDAAALRGGWVLSWCARDWTR